MKTLYTMIDPYQPSQLTVHKDYQLLAKHLGFEHKYYTIEQIEQGQVEPDSSNEVIFIFEAALLKVSNRTTKDIKAWFPNAKLVVLASESLTYIYGYNHFTNNPTKEFEFYDGHDVDLWLDINDYIVEEFKKKGINTDYWMWTTSQFLIDEFLPRPKLPKTQDIICLIGHRREYRNAMVNYLEPKFKCQWGRGAGDGNYDFDHLHQSFSSSWVTLGTTSPCWWTQRSCKGFRDWMGPINGTVLIYDNHPDIIRKHSACPIYNYDDFHSIENLINELKIDRNLYKSTLDQQIHWITQNTIAHQLLDRLIKHKIICDPELSLPHTQYLTTL